MADRLAEVEISKDGDVYQARITLPSGEVVNLENEQFEDILEQIANDLGVNGSFGSIGRAVILIIVGIM